MADIFPFLEDSGWVIEYGLALGSCYNNPAQFLVHHPYMRKAHVLDGRVGTPYARQDAIRRLLKLTRPDVVMPLALGDTLPALRAERIRGLRTRLLLAVHSSHVGTLADIIENDDIVEMVGVVSGLMKRWGDKRLEGNQVRVRWIRNGVPSPVRARTEKALSTLRMGYIGRLENGVKRAEDVPLVIANCVGRGVPLRVEIVGDGPSRSRIINALRLIPGWDNFNYHGFQSRSVIYDAILPEIDCLLLTSETEGSPLAVIEAMHHGVVPVVSQFHGHAAEGMLQPEKNCLVFPIGDTQCAAEQLGRLVFDSALFRRLSESAVTTAARYTQSNMKQGWLSALEEVSHISCRPCISRSRLAVLISGRLERWGVPPSIANLVRRFKENNLLHGSGFDEWPGSLSSGAELFAQIRDDLAVIESECSDELRRRLLSAPR